MRLSVAFIALSLVALPALYWEFTILERIVAGKLDAYDAELIRYETYAQNLFLIHSGVFLLSALVSTVWVYRASANVAAIDPVTTRITPVWSVAWWFIPIANLWMPFKVVKQIWNSSHGEDIELSPAPRYFGLWWGLWILAMILDRIAHRLSMQTDNVDGFVMSSLIYVAATLLDIGAALLWVRILREITTAQTDGRGTAEVFS